MSSQPPRPGSDPFGSPRDPFGGGPVDPFGAPPAGDPFAVGTRPADPFAAGAPTADPFGPTLVGAGPSVATPAAVAGRVRKPGRVEQGRFSRGGWWAIGLVGGGLGLALLTLYLAFDALDLISDHPIGSALLWLAACAIACGVITVGLMVAVIVLARRRPPLLPAIALVTGVLIAPLGFFAVAQLGVDSVLTEARESVTPVAGDSVAAIAEYAEGQGVDLGPFGPLLRALGSD